MGFVVSETPDWAHRRAVPDLAQPHSAAVRLSSMLT